MQRLAQPVATPRALLNLLTLAAVALSCAVPGAFAAEPGPIPIASFGAGGEAVPEAAVAFLGQEFFSRNLVADSGSGENFTSSLRIPKSVDIPFDLKGVEAGTKRVSRPASEIALALELSNGAALTNDIVVSALLDRGGEVRNHIVRVEPGESVRIDASALAEFDQLFFLSLHAFSVKADVVLDGAIKKSFSPDVLTRVPRVATKSGIPDCDSATAYCSECNQTIEICLDGTTNCIIAFAKRRFSHSSGSSDWYSVDIYYPSSSTKFHCYGSATRVGGEPNCKNSTIATSRCSDSSIAHRWRGIDDTLFNGTQSTAECTDGCSDSFTVDRL